MIFKPFTRHFMFLGIKKGAFPNGNTPILFSLLSSLTKETRHSVDCINLRVHNHISINLSAFDVGMPHEFTNRKEVTTSSKGEDSKGVSACVEGCIFLNSSSLAPFMNDSVTLT